MWLTDVSAQASLDHITEIFHWMDRQKDRHNKEWHYSEWQAKSLPPKWDHSACVSKKCTLSQQCTCKCHEVKPQLGTGHQKEDFLQFSSSLSVIYSLCQRYLCNKQVITHVTATTPASFEFPQSYIHKTAKECKLRSTQRFSLLEALGWMCQSSPQVRHWSTS